jgi:hypothetical protein
VLFLKRANKLKKPPKQLKAFLAYFRGEESTPRESSIQTTRRRSVSIQRRSVSMQTITHRQNIAIVNSKVLRKLYKSGSPEYWKITYYANKKRASVAFNNIVLAWKRLYEQLDREPFIRELMRATGSAYATIRKALAEPRFENIRRLFTSVEGGNIYNSEQSEAISTSDRAFRSIPPSTPAKRQPTTEELRKQIEESQKPSTETQWERLQRVLGRDNRGHKALSTDKSGAGGETERSHTEGQGYLSEAYGDVRQAAEHQSAEKAGRRSTLDGPNSTQRDGFGGIWQANWLTNILARGVI